MDTRTEYLVVTRAAGDVLRRLVSKPLLSREGVYALTLRALAGQEPVRRRRTGTGPARIYHVPIQESPCELQLVEALDGGLPNLAPDGFKRVLVLNRLRPLPKVLYRGGVDANDGD